MSDDYEDIREALEEQRYIRGEDADEVIHNAIALGQIDWLREDLGIQQGDGEC